MKKKDLIKKMAKNHDTITDKEIRLLLTNYYAGLGIDFKRDLSLEFQKSLIQGYRVEQEHGTYMDPRVNVTNNKISATIRISLAHILEMPDYYVRLKKMEEEGDRYWDDPKNQKEKEEKKSEISKLVERVHILDPIIFS